MLLSIEAQSLIAQKAHMHTRTQITCTMAFTHRRTHLFLKFCSHIITAHNITRQITTSPPHKIRPCVPHMLGWIMSRVVRVANSLGVSGPGVRLVSAMIYWGFNPILLCSSTPIAPHPTPSPIPLLLCQCAKRIVRLPSSLQSPRSPWGVGRGKRQQHAAVPGWWPAPLHILLPKFSRGECCCCCCSSGFSYTLTCITVTNPLECSVTWQVKMSECSVLSGDEHACNVVRSCTYIWAYGFTKKLFDTSAVLSRQASRFSYIDTDCKYNLFH